MRIEKKFMLVLMGRRTRILSIVSLLVTLELLRMKRLGRFSILYFVPNLGLGGKPFLVLMVKISCE